MNRSIVKLFVAVGLLITTRCNGQVAADLEKGYSIFEHPGRMLRLPTGNRLSLYCQGNGGGTTVVLETGFGESAYNAWHQLQPQIAEFTRVCSYDRAGYGFSELGNDLPRDVKHDVLDLHALLHAANLPGPYLLVAHSDGGHIIGSFSDLYPKETAGLFFLDAAVLLRKPTTNRGGAVSSELTKYFRKRLQLIKDCLRRTQSLHSRLQPRSQDGCLSSESLAGLPPKMAETVTVFRSRPAFWKAYLSESEQHYLVTDDHWEANLLPHQWLDMPIRVFIASVASLDDASSARAYGLPADDHAAISAARAGRAQWEALQASICDLSNRCLVNRVPTAEHEVQNVIPERIAEAIRMLVR